MSEIDRAAQLLRDGKLVAFPTETVYGLGADATRSDAVQKIFAAKGRPSTNPLIAHVASADIARRYCTTWPEEAQQLAEAFWPGPLTIVLPKSSAIAVEVTAGKRTVGLRVPNHPIALQLLKAFDGPVAAPSANRSNHVSPTTAEHVRQELGNDVNLILDGGPCDVGIESTVLDLTLPKPKILRPGGVTREQIESIIGPVDIFQGATASTTAAASPGQHAKHYSPATPAFRFETHEKAIAISHSGSLNAAYMLFNSGDNSAHSIHMPNDPVKYAHELYSTLRKLDDQRFDAIYVQMPPDEPRWFAVRDRLMRATQTIPI